MNIQRVKQGARLTIYNGVYMIAVGIFFILFAGFNMSNNFKAISAFWELFQKYNPEIARLFVFLSMTNGVFLISMGIIIIYLSYYILKRKDKITWVVLFLSGVIGWGGFFTISILTKNLLTILLSFLGWLFFIMGMVIPIRYYLEKSYREY